MRDIIDIVEAYCQLLERAGPLSLIGFIVRHGGVKDVGGNLRAMGLRVPGLIRRNGIGLDRMREMAAEAGYLGADTEAAVAETDINDFIEAIANHPCFSVYDDEEVSASTNRVSRSQKREHADAKRAITAHHGHQLDGDLLDRAAWMVVHDHTPIEHAYEDAQAESERYHAPSFEHNPDLDRIDSF